MTDTNDPISEEVAALKHEAVEKTGLNDFGNSFFEGPLTAWVADLGITDLNDFGRQFLRRAVLRDLCRRLRVLACLAEHPEILEVKMPPIVFILGAPRTGTTLLHNLMATHPRGRPLLRWELSEPVPPPTSETYPTDPRIAKVQASIEPLRGSLLEKMHWINADEPEENRWGFIDCTGMVGGGVWPIMPTWWQWPQDHDHSPTLRDFRKLVQILIWKCPPPPGGHLVLKCIATASKPQTYADVFPEATFVLTHRDPFRALVSSCTIYDGIYMPFIRDHQGPLYEDGIRRQHAFEEQKKILRGLVEFAKTAPRRITNVRYADLMSDAVSATRSAYDNSVIDVPEDLEERIIGYFHQQRSGRRAAPPERYETYGYGAETIWSDPTVAEYCEFFQVDTEPSRLVDSRTGF